MPYTDDDNTVMMLANIASIEIPPITSSYLDWLRMQDNGWLNRFGVDKLNLHDRQFLPRTLLGEYLRNQLLAVVEEAQARNLCVESHESCEVTDIELADTGVSLFTQGQKVRERFDLVVIATGHVWPDDDETPKGHFPSPWSGLIETKIGACNVGIMGTSLSAIDATMAVVAQHGRFVEVADEALRFDLHSGSDGLHITLMSRSGLLPEADFYCPIPYDPLHIATDDAIEKEMAAGTAGLLDRAFTLIAKEISRADPVWSNRISLTTLDADSFATAYFADRKHHAPFHWAEFNLREVERNKRDRCTVPWRYAILRLHEAVQPIVGKLSADDRCRFDSGLCKVFVDNYAAVPSESIRRLLALHQAKLLSVVELGDDYQMEVQSERTTIRVDDGALEFDVFIDARGQRPLKTKDLPFPTLRKQLMASGDEMPDVGEDYTLLEPPLARGRVAIAALPYLMSDRPFIQGITASADIGAAIANAAMKPPNRPRKKLLFLTG
ncbi:putative NAD(P)/FAD-binding protein YdhS [Lysobacter enzymogenes]